MLATASRIHSDKAGVNASHARSVDLRDASDDLGAIVIVISKLSLEHTLVLKWSLVVHPVISVYTLLSPRHSLISALISNFIPAVYLDERRLFAW